MQKLYKIQLMKKKAKEHLNYDFTIKKTIVIYTYKNLIQKIFFKVKMESVIQI